MGRLDGVARDLGHQLVAAHADGAVDPPQRHLDVVGAEGTVPRDRVVVGRVDEGAVDVQENDRGVHGPTVVARRVPSGPRVRPRCGVGAGWQGDAMALHLHVAERTDALADGLADLLATPLDDPFAREVVVVPARGVERWVTQRLSHRLGVGARSGDGVCAGVDFVTPHSLVSMLLGKDSDDPWEPDRLAWPLLEVIDRVHGRDRLRGAQPRTSAAAIAETSARPAATPWPGGWPGLFASYAVQRPALVTDWREGRDTDGAGGDLEPDLRWQAELWRRLLVHVGTPPPDVRHADDRWTVSAAAAPTSTCRRGCPSSATRDCPRPRSRSCGALGDLRDVHLWLPQASPQLWSDLAPTATEGQVPARPPTLRRPRRTPAARLARARLPRAATHARRRTHRAHGGCDPVPARLAARLAPARPARQRRPRRRPARPATRSDDRSVQIHACHGVGAPGRRAARGAGRPAPGRPDPRAARHPRDVPRHRVLRPAHLRGLRARRRRRPTAPGIPPTSCGCASPTGRWVPPTRCSASPPRSSSSCAAA